jgi:hypothetical protein
MTSRTTRNDCLGLNRANSRRIASVFVHQLIANIYLIKDGVGVVGFITISWSWPWNIASSNWNVTL